jgi:hypothetical protein
LDENYDGWEGDLIRSAEEHGIPQTYEAFKNERQDVSEARENVMTAIEDVFRPEQSFVDRVLRR